MKKKLVIVLLLIICSNIYAQTKKKEPAQVTESFTPSADQKSKIIQINADFRNKVQVLNKESDVSQKMVKLKVLREERDDQLLVLLGEKQYNAYRSFVSPKSGKDKYEKAKLSSATLPISQKLKLSKTQVKEFETIEAEYQTEKKRLAGTTNDQLRLRNKLDSLSDVKAEKLRALLSNEQFGLYQQWINSPAKIEAN